MGPEMRLDPSAVISDLDDLAAQSGGRFAGADRLAWTPAWERSRALLRSKLEAAGALPWQDAAGNLWAEVPGSTDRFVIVGSHIDAVPGGGWLDGALGVMAGVEVIRQARRGPTVPIGVRFVDWADEEGARFGRSLFGSSAWAGTLVPDEVRELVDAEGVRLEDALAACEVRLDRLGLAPSERDRAVAYLELHVEQGPILRGAGRLASAVSGTVGVERHLVTFSGASAHAGSTPMRMRHDSLAAAACATVQIREDAIARGGVATVGRLDSQPGVITAVAGETTMHLDQRHPDARVLAEMLSEAAAICERSAAELGCQARLRRVWRAAPTPFDAALVSAARRAVREAGGGDGEPVASGALHDATEIGRRVPTAMIFAQSDPPVSHSVVEDSPIAALEVAIDAYGRLVDAVLREAVEA